MHDEGEGILAWLVEGCMEWQRAGLKEPEKVLDAVKEYRREQSAVSDFIEQCCVSWLDHPNRDQFKIKPADLYGGYTAWCKVNGEKDVLSGRKFGGEMTDRGYMLKSFNGVNYRLGITLNSANTVNQRDF